eukprot:CAMPEP_0170489272 /NCGR_PEP_ID=MMETSP0208-20121228/7646_1 /TAXON_ID=197538 /ORGANISM="Strombidium inclinatum, Strain S3" /LENGTH=117 /DNA_ID=CAMNT_0010764119 /DNA_START=739 /DNA_END=1092 /DNA_ORIENTATION=+
MVQFLEDAQLLHHAVEGVARPDLLLLQEPPAHLFHGILFFGRGVPDELDLSEASAAEGFDEFVLVNQTSTIFPVLGRLARISAHDVVFANPRLVPLPAAGERVVVSSLVSGSKSWAV